MRVMAEQEEATRVAVWNFMMRDDERKEKRRGLYRGKRRADGQLVRLRNNFLFLNLILLSPYLADLTGFLPDYMPFHCTHPFTTLVFSLYSVFLIYREK